MTAGHDWNLTYLSHDEATILVGDSKGRLFGVDRRGVDAMGRQFVLDPMEFRQPVYIPKTPTYYTIQFRDLTVHGLEVPRYDEYDVRELHPQSFGYMSPAYRKPIVVYTAFDRVDERWYVERH